MDWSIIGIALAIFLAMIGFSAFILYLSFRLKVILNEVNWVIKIVLLFGILFLAGTMFLLFSNRGGGVTNSIPDIINFLKSNPNFLISIILVVIGIAVLIKIRANKHKKDIEKSKSITSVNPPPTIVDPPPTTQPPKQTTQYHQDLYTWIPGKLVLPDQSEILINEKEKQFGRDDFTKNFPGNIEKVKYLSRNHFKIINDNGKYYIEDSSSTGGTKLNGVEIKKIGKQQLNIGDKILLAGSLELIFNQQQNQTQYNQYTLIPGKLILPDQSEILINEKEKQFGREDFIKNFPEKVRYISRNHFKILNDNGKYYIEDSSSTGGTKLNGVEIKKLGKQLLNKGDKILLSGSLELIFLADMRLS